MKSDEQKARNNKIFAKPKLFRQAIDEFLEKILPDIADSLEVLLIIIFKD